MRSVSASGVVAFALVLSVSLSVGAVSAFAGEPVNEALGFTRVIQDPVSGAMGGAGVVMGNAWSSYRNVAAVPFSESRLDVALGYQDWCASSDDPTSDINVGVAWTLGKNKKVALTAGFTYGICGSYDIIYDDGSTRGKTFTPNEVQANLGVAWKFLPFLSIGANFKYLSEKLSDKYTNSAFSTDIFLMTKLSDFRIALGVSSLGTDIDSASGNSFSLPSSVTLGFGYNPVFGKHGLDILLDGDYYYNSSTASVAFGAGYTYNKHVSVRAGYHYGSESKKDDGMVVSCVVPSYVSIGIGGAVAGFRLDFAYLIPTGSSSPLKNTFALALGYSF